MRKMMLMLLLSHRLCLLLSASWLDLDSAPPSRELPRSSLHSIHLEQPAYRHVSRGSPYRPSRTTILCIVGFIVLTRHPLHETLIFPTLHDLGLGLGLGFGFCLSSHDLIWCARCFDLPRTLPLFGTLVWVLSQLTFR